MSYLFGDSTPSPFRINFVEFLRLAMGFSVHVLRVERRVLTEQMKRIQLEDDSERDRQHLDQLLGRLTKTIQEASAGYQPRVVEHADLIQGKAREVVELGLQSVQQALAEDLAEIEQNIQLERKSSLNALEKVLLVYDLPEAKNTVHVRLQDGGRYSAWLESVTPYGLTTSVELILPPDSPFAHDARVDRFMDGFEIHAPETAGWIRKESRMVPQKLGRFYITELTLGEACLIKLRSSPEANASGYDIAVQTEEPQVRFVKTGKDGEGGSFAPEPIDLPTVLRLREKLEEVGRAISTKRRALTSARLGEDSIEQSSRMRAFVEQLAQVVGPMVREIAAHSLSPSELVLRRMMGDDRREEIFVSKVELQANLDGLSDADRQLFAPLELQTGTPAVSAIASRVSQAPPEGKDEERAPPSGARRSNRPPPMRSGLGG
jgi:hypothetical protein